MSFKAIIFDFDGVITDTEPIHMKAWLEVLSQLGISFEKEEYSSHYLGLNDRDFLDAVGNIHKRTFPSEEKVDLISKKLGLTIELLNQNIPLIDGVKEFVERSSRQYALAICSGAIKKEVFFILDRLGWSNIFNPIITQEDVTYGKPNPEGFKLTFELLKKRGFDRNLSPTDCLVIEDSPKGIAAAHAAGMKCLAIGNSYPASKLAKADWTVSNLLDFKLLQDL